MTISLWLAGDATENSKEELAFDLVIIGGGAMGASAAYLASSRNGTDGKPLKVAIIESGKIACGASGRNSGFVLRGIHTYYRACVEKYGREAARAIYHMGEESQKALRDFVADGADIDYDPCGSYILASSLEELEDLSSSAALMLEDGFDLTLHQGCPLDRGFYGAICNPSDFGINPVKLVRALVERSSATVYQDQPLERVEIDSGGVLLETLSFRVRAAHVLFATNAYTQALGKLVMPEVKPVRSQMFATAPLKKRLVDRLCYANYGFEYFRQLSDNRMLIGGSRQHFKEEEVGFEDRVTPAVQNALDNYFKEHFPEAVGVTVQHRWSGVMALTDDGLPYVGEMTGQKGISFLVGCNGHGLGYSLALSRLALDSIYAGEDPGIFAASRKATQTKTGVLVEASSGP